MGDLAQDYLLFDCCHSEYLQEDRRPCPLIQKETANEQLNILLCVEDASGRFYYPNIYKTGKPG